MGALSRKKKNESTQVEMKWGYERLLNPVTREQSRARCLWLNHGQAKQSGQIRVRNSLADKLAMLIR